MSFWPLCCKPPQVHAIQNGEPWTAQFPNNDYNPFSPAGRPPYAEHLHVAGARSGRVVINPVVFKSVCDSAGVSNDGKLYVWAGDAAEAAKYRLSSYASQEETNQERILRGRGAPISTPPGDFSSVYQIGADEDWESVSSSGGGSIMCVKADGTVWMLGDRQFGVDEFSAVFTSSSPGQAHDIISPLAWRARLNCAIERFEPETSATTLNESFGLPVWFTAMPEGSPRVQKLCRRRLPVPLLDEVIPAAGEPGSGAVVTGRFRAKIDNGSIRAATVANGGSGIPPLSQYQRTIVFEGHEGTGSGAEAVATVSDGSLISVVIINPGEGYRFPVTGRVNSATDYGEVLSVAAPKTVRVTNGGSGYKTVPSVVVSPAEGEESEDWRTETAVIEVSEMSRCAIEKFDAVTGGTGYTWAAAVELRTGATAVGVIDELGQVIGWTLDYPGESLFSPLDEEPLAVEVYGDGEGAEATAVPQGSSVLALSVVANPEVWTLPPVLTIEGGGGSDAEAVVEGIIGRVTVAVENGGSGYTKTLESWSSDTSTFRNLFSPCATINSPPESVVGGRVLENGEVIVGEAMLAPGEIAEVKEDLADYVLPYTGSGSTLSPFVFIGEDEALRRHHLAMALKLTVGSEGVVHPFEEEMWMDELYFTPGVSEDERAEYVAHTIKAWLRGPGHERHELNVTYDRPGYIKIRLDSPLQMQQPPALCFERYAAPHKRGMYATETSRVDGVCYSPDILRSNEDKPEAKSWWTPPWSGDDLFVSGDVYATGSLGGSAAYKVVDGILRTNSAVEREWALSQEPPTEESQIDGLYEYTGPRSERILQDPVKSWSQPADAQRIYFVYPMGEDVSAIAKAEVVYDASLRHPVVGPVEIVENGRYREEPEPMMLFDSDPLPVDTGLSGCTSAGFAGKPETVGRRTAYAHCNGQLYWWGSDAAIDFDFEVSQVYLPSLDDPAEVYAALLARFGGSGRRFTAKPVPVGGHLRFAVDGTLATDPAESTEKVLGFMRMPRPQYGNRTADISQIFSSSGSALSPAPPGQIRDDVPLTGDYRLAPGTHYNRRHESSLVIASYIPFDVREMDHGVGYEGSASLEYRGPGLLPHTISITPTVVGNDIAHVGKNGLLRDSQGKWRLPFQASQTFASGWRSEPHTFAEKIIRRDKFALPEPCLENTSMRYGWRYTVTEQKKIDLKRFAVVVRTPGRGYRDADGSQVEKDLGRGFARVNWYIRRHDFTKEPTLIVPDDAGGGQTYIDEFTAPEVEITDYTTHLTSSYGGFVKQLVGELVGDFSAIEYRVLGIDGGGSDAVIEVVEIDPLYRETPFGLLCLDDDIDQSIEPVPFFTYYSFEDRWYVSYALAVAADGTLRIVVSSIKRAWTPEAVTGFPQVTSLAEGHVPLPHAGQKAANALARTDDGRLWAISGPRASEAPRPNRGVFMVSQDFAETAMPIAVSPVALSLTSTGSGYDLPVSAKVSPPPGVAQGGVVIDGKLVGMAVIDGGSGYETPPVVSILGEGGGAAEANISGPIWRVDVTSQGEGYRLPPKVRFSPTGSPATAVASIVDGKVTSVEVTDGGLYRQFPPTVWFEPVKDIEAINVVSGGQKYSTKPQVIIDNNEGAAAEAHIECSVTEIVLASPGFAYNTTPIVEIIGDGEGATARAVLDPATGTLARIEVTNGGSKYTTPPAVRIVATDRGGGAIAYSKIEGSVVRIAVSSRGRGFETPPLVILTGGGGTGAEAVAVLGSPGSGAQAAARLNGSVTSLTVTSQGSGYQRPPVVSFAHSSPAVAGLSRRTAIAKATTLGRPVSVAVTNPGQDYTKPFYSIPETPDAWRRTQSRPIRRPVVAAKGSFYLQPGSHHDTSRTDFIGLFSQTKRPVFSFGSVSFQSVLNTFPLLGVASLEGSTIDSGGAVSSVILPTVVKRLQIQSPGSGYPPNSVVTIRISGDGTRDDRFRAFWDNDLSRTYFTGTSVPAQPLPNEFRVGDSVGVAYTNSEGSLTGVILGSGRRPYYGLPLGLTPYLESPTFEIDSQTGSGAVVVGELDHPLECYCSPQAIFDGDIEVEADTALVLAGVSVEGGGAIPMLCAGGGVEYPFWAGTLNPGLTPTPMLLFIGTVYDGNFRSSVPQPEDVRTCLAGGVAAFASLESPAFWSVEDKEYFEAPAGFYSQPPDVVVEDENGLGAVIAPAELPPGGAISPKWLGDCTVSEAGVGYTLGSRIRLFGGRPLAWDNPATATVVVRETGEVDSVTLQSSGAGYTSPPVIYIVGDGDGATVVADEIDPLTGSIISLRLVSRGSGYTAAVVKIVDRESVAEQSDAVAGLCDFIDRKYTIVLSDSVVERAFIPPDRRRRRTTVSARNLPETLEVGPTRLSPSGVSLPNESLYYPTKGDALAAAGYRLHPAYSSDGYVEYIRLEHHHGEFPPESPVVTITANSDVVPAIPATAIAMIPKVDDVFSGTVANVVEGGVDFPPYQLGGSVLNGDPLIFDVDAETETTYSENITGSGDVIKQGSGALSLEGWLDIVGSLIVDAGDVVIRSPTVRADIKINGGDLIFDTEGTVSHQGSITGQGDLIKRGTGTLILSASPSIAGAVTIEAGTLAAESLNVSGEITISQTGSLSADVVLAGGTLIFDTEEAVSYTGNITGSGSVIKRGSGSLTFNGRADFSGSLAFSGGTLGGSLTVGENTTVAALSQITGSIILDGGTLVFAEYEGPPHSGSVSGNGVARLPAGETLTLAEEGITVGSGVSLEVSGVLKIEDGFTGQIDVTLDGGRLVFDVTESVSYSGDITGIGEVVKYGEGTLTFGGLADFVGVFDVETGTLAGSIEVGAATSVRVYGEMSANATLAGGVVAFLPYGDAVYAGSISGTGTLKKSGPGRLTLLGQSDFSGEAQVYAGTLRFVDETQLTANIRLDDGSLVFDVDGGYTHDGSILGGGAVIKRGLGDLTLSSRCPFLGVFSVEDGSVTVNEGVDSPEPFASATFTPTELEFAFQGEPTVGAEFNLFNAETVQQYTSVSIVGAAVSGSYLSSQSRLFITA